LATYYFFQQNLDQAIAHLKKATAVGPKYSPAYNILGYSYRQQGHYSEAEQAFRKYINLIPNDPNPYDSYAELLLKTGRFDDSIAQYRKAIGIDPHWMSGHLGIACNFMYEGNPTEANAELEKMAAQAQNELQLRTAYFSMAVVAADEGKLDDALQAMDKEYMVTEKKSDVALMAADLQAIGNILVEVPNYDMATNKFTRSLQMIQQSALTQDIKDNAKLLQDYDLAGIAIAKKDYAAAKTYTAAYQEGAYASKNSVQIQLAHELAGRIAFGEQDYAKAIAELEQSNLEDPRNLYRLGLIYQAKGDTAKTQQFMMEAAKFYSLPQLNYAFIRAKALADATPKPGEQANK
jgi:tetratricopeptide (TPR) repeat protein